MSLEDTTDEGRMWAAISYGSSFLGLPLGIIPLVQRNDAFALHHAKAALGMQLAFFVAYVVVFAISFPLAFCTFGFGTFISVPVMMLMMVWPVGTSVHGIVLSLNGDWEPALGTFDIGERLFEQVQLDEAVTADPTALPGPAADEAPEPPAV